MFCFVMGSPRIRHFARGRPEDAVEMLEKRALAGTVGPDDRDPRIPRGDKIDTFECFDAVRIRVTEIPCFNEVHVS